LVAALGNQSPIVRLWSPEEIMTTTTIAEITILSVQDAIFHHGKATDRASIPTESPPESEIVIDDQALMHAAAQYGEPMVFNRVVERFGVRILRFLECLVGDRARARDLAQESFLRLHTCFKKQDQKRDGNAVSLLYVIAGNLGRDELRRRSVRRESPLNCAAIVPITENETRLERDERNEQVMLALAELDDDTRLLLVLREIQELSYDEIASIQGLAIGTVKSRISRARLAFRDIWTRYQRSATEGAHS
jgi:RNA polymerase sigma-70 factor, ECF subfamily